LALVPGEFPVMNPADLTPSGPQHSFQSLPPALGAPVKAGDVIGQSGFAGAIVGPVKQATAAPIRKVIAGLIATGITWAVVLAARTWLKVEIPDTVAVPLTGGIFGIVAYLIPPGVGDIPVPVD